jgi:hypothetical protein
MPSLSLPLLQHQSPPQILRYSSLLQLSFNPPGPPIFACACVSACFLCLKLNSFGAFSEFVFGGWIERVYSGGSSGLSQWVLDSLSCYGYKRIFLCILFYILWLHFSWFLMNLFYYIISLCLLSEHLIENSRNMFLKVGGSVELLIYNV